MSRVGSRSVLGSSVSFDKTFGEVRGQTHEERMEWVATEREDWRG